MSPARSTTASPHRGPETSGQTHLGVANSDDPGELIPLIVNEIHRLIDH
jgi:hypothetical protein